jgi:hypothetical protein
MCHIHAIRSIQHIPVEAAVLDGLKQVRRLDSFGGGEVGFFDTKAAKDAK